MSTASQNVFGLFELDPSGVVFYSKVNTPYLPAKTPANMVGRNFFDEFQQFENIEELRKRFRYFANSSHTAEKFSMSSKFDENLVEMNVMLTRISEREFDGSKKLIILDIRYGNL